jgi:hypothetical protein
MMYLDTKFHLHAFSNSLAVTIKPEVEETFFVDTVLLFAFSRTSNLKVVMYCSKIYYDA